MYMYVHNFIVLKVVVKAVWVVVEWVVVRSYHLPTNVEHLFSSSFNLQSLPVTHVPPTVRRYIGVITFDPLHPPGTMNTPSLLGPAESQWAWLWAGEQRPWGEQGGGWNTWHSFQKEDEQKILGEESAPYTCRERENHLLNPVCL